MVKTPKRPSARKELKRSLEKKFRLRYASLQQAYEQRLEMLAAGMQDAVNQVHEDATIHCLSENALTHEYASARLGEIVHECFHGNREQYIKAMSDQIAWQASDLREAQQKLRIKQKNESDAQKHWRLAQREIEALHEQLKERVKELQEQKTREQDYAIRWRTVTEERDAARREIDELKQSVLSMETLLQEKEALTRRLQQEQHDQLAVRTELEQSRKQVQEVKNELKLIKQTSEQEAVHLKHLLMLSESKARDFAQALQKLQQADYPTKLTHVELELAHQQELAKRVENDHEDLKRRYQEFGDHVEQYMKEQTEEKAALVVRGDEKVKEMQTQLDTLSRQAQDGLKAKDEEIARAMELLSLRQDALDKAEKKITSLEECARVAEGQEREAKMQHSKLVASLEKEMKQWRLTLEKEQEKGVNLQQMLADTKDKYERKLVSIRDAMTRQARQEANEKEQEARTRWQTEFVAKQDARIDELKKKYDSALEKQQAELRQARQLAEETVKSAAAKWESTKLAQNEEENRERRRRFEDAAHEKERKEEHRALLLAQTRMQQEFDERENRLKERERALLDKEIREERRRVEGANRTATPPLVPTSPSVVVLNMSSSEDEEVERGERCTNIPLAQHIAELQTKEAQAALQAEERVQRLMQEFKERKEVEFRTAMVNVRKGIHKLEVAVEEARVEKKRVEEQLFTQQQAFASLKNEYEDVKDAKILIVQRLEEANENLGRLRSVVQELQVQCASLSEQYKTAIDQESEAQTALASEHNVNEQLREQLTRLNEAAVQLESSLGTSVESSEQSKKELLDRIAVMEHQLQAREEQFKTEMIALKEKNSCELRHVTLQNDTHIHQLEATIKTTQLEHTEMQTKAKELEKCVHDLDRAKKLLEAKVETMKAASLKQKKDFADLSRMHKNLTESVDSRLEAASEALENERSQRIAIEREALKAKEQAERGQGDRQKCVIAFTNGLRQLETECHEARKSVASELNVGWVYLQKEVALASVEWKKRMDEVLQAADAVWRRKAKQEKQEWKQRLAEKDKQLDELLASQRVTDQTKYDHVIDRLERKTQELEEVERRLVAQVERNADLIRTVHLTEEDERAKVMELTQLQERLAAAQVATQVERQEKEQVNALLKTQRAMCKNYRVFCAALAKQSGVNCTKNVANTDDEDENFDFDLRQLSAELTQLAVRLQEAQTQAIQKAIADVTVTSNEDVSTSSLSELETAKKTLEFLWCESLPRSSDSEYDGHLPWYTRAARTVKRERETNEQMVGALEREVAAKEAEKKVAIDRNSKWVEATNLLRFEKDTVVREMELLRQTMEKRKAQELQEVQVEYDARIKQQNQRHARALLKHQEDNETAMNRLRDMLKAEQRSTRNAKNEVIDLKVTLERTEEELKELQQKVDKETDELRETASKWKRKAKLAIKNGGLGISLKAQKLHMSSSSLGTEDDSDASYRTMFPHSRRASNAMADLSSLMEQSLVNIRNESQKPMSRLR